jgi:hypothetical protein
MALMWLHNAPPTWAVVERPSDDIVPSHDDPSHGASCVGEQCGKGSGTDIAVIGLVLLAIVAIAIVVRTRRSSQR